MMSCRSAFNSHYEVIHFEHPHRLRPVQWSGEILACCHWHEMGLLAKTSWSEIGYVADVDDAYVGLCRQTSGQDPDNENPNLYNVFMEQSPTHLAIHETPFGFDLIPGHSLLAGVEEALEPGDEMLFRNHILGVVPDCDYLILDTPPGTGMLSISALAEADEVIIPLQTERPALDGTADVLRFIQDIVWDQYNPDREILGILPTMVRRTTSHSPGVVKKAPEPWGDKVLAVAIPTAVSFLRSFDRGQPLLYFQLEHEAAKLCLELVQRQLELPTDDN